MSNHAQKTAIRARMRATGENYTTARRAIASSHTRATRTHDGYPVRSVETTFLNDAKKAFMSWMDAHTQAVTLTLEYTGSPEYISATLPPALRVDALNLNPGPRRPHEEWAYSPNRGGWVPPRRSQATADLAALSREPLSGLDPLGYWLHEAPPFLYGGAAWARVPAPPATGSGWEAVTEDQYREAASVHAAQVRVIKGRLTARAVVKHHVDPDRAEDLRRIAAQGFHAQHVRAAAPHVIAAVDRAETARREARKRSDQWEQDNGMGWDRESRLISYADALGSFPLGVYGSRPERLGEWVEHFPRWWFPAEGNPVLEEWETLGSLEDDIPGVDRRYEGANPGEELALDVFVRDGAAWARVGQFPWRGKFGPEWEEVPASALM